MLKREVWSTVEYARVVECCAVIQLVQRNYVVMGVGQDQMARKPARSVPTSVLCSQLKQRDAQIATFSATTYMNPAPPVINMFFTSSSGEKHVLPMNTGACFQSSSLR